MTSLFSVLGQTMPEKEVSLNKDIGIWFTSKLLISKGLCILSQFAISKVNQRLYCPNIDSSLLTIVKKKINPCSCLLWRWRYFFHWHALLLSDLRLVSRWWRHLWLFHSSPDNKYPLGRFREIQSCPATPVWNPFRKLRCKRKCTIQ